MTNSRTADEPAKLSSLQKQSRADDMRTDVEFRRDEHERRKKAKEFARAWAAKPGRERAEAQLFWADLIQELFSVKFRDYIDCEGRTGAGGFYDVLIPDPGVLIEHKSKGVDLDKPEIRQGTAVTPFEQALRYAESFPRAEQPRFIVICNFETFRVYDRDLHGRHELANKYVEFTLDELGDKPHLLDFIKDPAHSRARKEEAASIEAGELIGELYNSLAAQYVDPTSPVAQHSLNVLCVRLVFCLFCEDVDLFPKDSFYEYLSSAHPDDIRNKLKNLFQWLNTKLEDRNEYDQEIYKGFPYVNGGLFADADIEIPNFTQEIKDLLLERVSRDTDWSNISPTIFGGIFEGTLNPETRRAAGMHYTSPENIHKVIDPLFLDELRKELDEIYSEAEAGSISQLKKKNRLVAFQKKLTSLTFFDPAAGSGNFLTETYIQLRLLEDNVFNSLLLGQTALSFNESHFGDLPRVTLTQFHGIEINDFAVSVANAALWIAQLQANVRSEAFLDIEADYFPLSEKANIVCENALQSDWESVLPADKCSYIIGNPPFIGYSSLNDEQKMDRAAIFGARGGLLDYVACWYAKASKYSFGHHVRCAFVSTNSICQGQQVQPLWQPLFDSGIHIDFAHRSFVWSNEANGQAKVHVVIVGFSREKNKDKKIFSGDTWVNASNINAYLVDAPNLFVRNRTQPLSDVPPIVYGNKPADGGYLLLTPQERIDLLGIEPAAERFIRPMLGADEFINGRQRYCLWIADEERSLLATFPEVLRRVKKVYEFRSASTKEATQLVAQHYHRFAEIRQSDSDYIIVPRHSSEKRRYVPLGFQHSGVIVNDAVTIVPDANLYHFGVLTSQFHNAWMRYVAGRLKADYRYSNRLVYNNFVWPVVDELHRTEIESCAQEVLDARAEYQFAGDSATEVVSLGVLYDPDEEYRFPRLIRAHQAVDRAVEAAYGVSFGGDESQIVSYLFGLYGKAIRAEQRRDGTRKRRLGHK